MHIRLSTYAATLLAVLFALTACTSFFEDEGDCAVTYRLRFRYDYNMKYADAFAHEVKSVSVWAWDENDRLAWSGTESGAHLSAEDFSIVLPLAPGKYRIVAWCGASNNPGHEHFSIAGGSGSVTRPEQLTCSLVRKHDGTTDYQDEDLHPLFYGSATIELPDAGDEGGDFTYVIPLVKDTNQLRVMLQHLSGKDVSADDFTFTITADNGSMLADNSIEPGTPVQYRPWGTFSGVAGVDTKCAATPGDAASPPSTRTVTQVSMARVDFTIPRMTVAQRNTMMLTITRRSDGYTIARIPVVDYALMVKDYDSHGAPRQTNQEYLDRQDTYSMMFFLDENGLWLQTVVYVNSWRIVLHDYEI